MGFCYKILFLIIITLSNLCLYIGNASAKPKPKIIGVIGSFQENKNQEHKSLSIWPFYNIGQRNLDNLSNACAGQNVVFVIIPEDYRQINNYVRSLDALVLTGGGEDEVSYRGNFEKEMVLKMMKRKKQIFGICRGFQMLNYIAGGEISVKISDHVKTNIQHGTPQCRTCDFTKHDVKLNKKSRLAKILKKTDIKVNSNHNYMLGKLGKNVVVTGVSPEDNIPEVLEIKGYKKFLLGVQWHPEFLATDDDVKILQAFCKAVVNNQ